MDLLAVWKQAQPSIKTTIGSTSYDTWFSCVNVEERAPGVLVFETPDEFFKNWIVEHYRTVIENALKALSPSETVVALEFIVSARATQLRPASPAGSASPTDARGKEDIGEKDAVASSSAVQPRFTFENFVIGPSNRFAHAASFAVAESPAKTYNPLFIHGGSGLGKTHLMQSIANRIKEKRSEAKFCYISSERFTNELIDAIAHRQTKQFRQKYRKVDVLLIDDIHFIAGKESTQEEFFHTFNDLYESRKQIVISSDRPPKSIARLEERLVTRFSWGLVADIQPPDFETRVAILRKKIEREPTKIPDDVICFIAEQIKTNIRELEGALVRVMAYSLLEESPVSLEMAKTVLKELVKETARIIGVDAVQKVVANYYDVSLHDLKTVRRNRNVVLPRQVAMFLTRKLTHLSLPEIGGAFGGKDHTTVLHSCKKIEQLSSKDYEFKNLLERLSNEIKT